MSLGQAFIRQGLPVNQDMVGRQLEEEFDAKATLKGTAPCDPG